MATIRSSNRTLSSPHSTKRKHLTPVPLTSNEVIVLSSDDEGTQARCKKNGQKKTKRPKRPAPTLEQIVDISSDDGDTGTVVESASQVKAQMAKLMIEHQCWRNTVEEERKTLLKEQRLSTIQAEQDKQRLADSQLAIQNLQAEVIALRTKPSIVKGKVVVDESELLDVSTCEICSVAMWKPYILQCSHSFCGSCIEDWFETTLKQHVNLHPNARPILERADLALIVQDALMAQHIHRNIPFPTYTCPHCRSTITIPPVENLALKTVVRLAAAVTGELSPKKAEPARQQRPAGGNVWSKFFPFFKPS